MTTTLSAHGGGAQPARIDSSGKVTGGAAMRVYGFVSEAEAQAAGYVCEGGPAMSVALITDAQLASGEWKLDGDPFAVVIYTAPDSLPTEGGFAVPVYAVNGWGGAPVPPSGPVPLLDLEADTLVLSDGDPVALWADQSGNGYDFTASGSARPTYHTGSGIPYVQFDSVDDLMTGPNVFDNPATITAIAVVTASTANGVSIFAKYLVPDGTPPGYGLDISGIDFIQDDNWDNELNALNNTQSRWNNPNKHVISGSRFDVHDAEIRIDGVKDDTLFNTGNFQTSANSGNTYLGMNQRGHLAYALRIYIPVLSPTDRAAVEAELAARYGITL